MANIEFTCPENSNWCLSYLLPNSNLFLKFQNNFTAEFWATFSWRLLLQRFFWNSSGVFIISVKLLISQDIFTVNEIDLFRTIAEWYLLFFTKFRSHRVKNEKVMTKTSLQLNAPVLMTEVMFLMLSRDIVLVFLYFMYCKD